MTKTRVPKGEQYWSIYIIASSGPQVYQTEEKNSDGDNDNFKCGNYFRTKVEADAMAKKLIAVLKGAEVIEMPNEEEIDKIMPKINVGDELVLGERVGWKACYYLIKSKIMK